MKKEPGRVRHVIFEEEVFVSAEDLIDQLEVFEKVAIKNKLSAKSAYNLLRGFLNTILASAKRRIPGATGNFKKLWSDKGSIN